MKTRPLLLTVTILLLLVCRTLGASDGSVTGIITDSQGAVISKARVLFHWDPSGSETGLKDNMGTHEDFAVVTDENGRYRASLPPGFYDVFISSMAFTPVAAKVRVTSGHKVTLNRRLAADPLVTKELGHHLLSPISR